MGDKVWNGKDNEQMRWRLSLVMAVLGWEYTWRVIWAPAAIVAGFVASALFGIPQALPAGLHAALLVAAGLSALVTLWLGVSKNTPPSRADALRRIEHDNGLKHRPLKVLGDRVVGSDPVVVALWTLHQEKIRSSLGRLRVGWPKPGVIEQDPFALRVLAGLGLLLAATASWGEWSQRLDRAIHPAFIGFTAPPPPVLDVWLTPPEYTQLPPRFLRTGGQDPERDVRAPDTIDIPRGSILTARVRGSERPSLVANDRGYRFDQVEPGTYQIERAIETGQRIAITDGGEDLAGWPVRVLEDRPPTIEFTENPAATSNAAIRFGYRVEDDYGVVALAFRIRAQTSTILGPAGTTVDFDLPMPSNLPRKASATLSEDLASHPWAGLPVSVEAVAYDGAKQSGTTSAVALTLPERAFNHPVARAAVAIRKQLVVSGEDGRLPAAEQLVALGQNPDAFKGDFTVALALRSAAARLEFDTDTSAIPSVVSLLWDTALRIEEGTQSVAERDLRDVQKRLSEALAHGGSDQDIQRLMEEVQKAIERYLEALQAQMRQAAADGNSTERIPPELADRIQQFDPADLQAMISRMRTLAETGSREAAQQMLAEIGEMLRGLQAGSVTREERDKQRRNLQLMRNLKGLVQRQQTNLDDVFRFSQTAENKGKSDSQGLNANTLAEREEKLRNDLAALVKELSGQDNGANSALNNADKAMQGAVQVLRRGQGASAVGKESQALEAMKQGFESVMQSLAQQLRGPGGAIPLAGSGESGGGRDPLGRRGGGSGGIDNGDVRIPADSEIQRAREILDDLRRRSGELGRPKLERDYIERLLRQF